MLLFINACVRKESRTKLLADSYLSKLGLPYEEVRLEGIDFPIVNESFLKKRDELMEEGKFDDPMFSLANQFAEAEEIVIAAPGWDLSFPASLKQYFEQINVIGITFGYTAEGMPKGLCSARKITYITTCGGTYFPDEYGFGYVKALATTFYGIKEVNLIKADGLDIDGADVESILKTAKEKI